MRSSARCSLNVNKVSRIYFMFFGLGTFKTLPRPICRIQNFHEVKYEWSITC